MASLGEGNETVKWVKLQSGSAPSNISLLLVRPNPRHPHDPVPLQVCLSCSLETDHVFTSREKLYSGGRKPIYSDVFRNRQC
jgi:hypothetical protein